MNFNDYQKQAITTDIMSSNGKLIATDPAFMAKILGLVGEAGEIAEKYKKIIRDKDGAISEADVTEITKELGDVLWYISALGVYMNVPLEDIAQANLDKLSSRKARGTQKGSGDNR